jgi:hypothetical protein
MLRIAALVAFVMRRRRRKRAEGSSIHNKVAAVKHKSKGCPELNLCMKNWRNQEPVPGSNLQFSSHAGSDHGQTMSSDPMQCTTNPAAISHHVVTADDLYATTTLFNFAFCMR